MSSEPAPSLPTSPSTSLLDFKQQWSQGRAKVLEAVQGVMQDRDKKEAVKAYIEELNVIVKEMEALVEKLKGKIVTNFKQSFLLVALQWQHSWWWSWTDLNPKVDSQPFAATVASAAPLQHYQVDPVHQPLPITSSPQYLRFYFCICCPVCLSCPTNVKVNNIL